jgi:hypothetical protein
VQSLTEKIKEDCLDSEKNIGDAVVEDTRHIAEIFPNLFPVMMSTVPDKGRRDACGVWKRTKSHLEYRMNIYEQSEIKIERDKKLQASVLLAIYLSGTRIRLAAIADRKFAGESCVVIYDGRSNERFIKSYNNGSYKSGEQLTGELAQEIRRRGWVDN